MPEIQVIGEGEVPVETKPAPTEDDAPANAGPQSPLALLRGKRKAAMAGLVKDFAVPRWEEHIGATLWVRYKPADPALYSQTIQRMEREFQEANAKKAGSGDPQWTTKANADVLVKACVAIFDLPVGEKPPDVLPTDIAYPTFGSNELAESLDIPTGSTIATARALYQTDGDLLLAANQLLDWSAQVSKEAEDIFLAD